MTEWTPPRRYVARRNISNFYTASIVASVLSIAGFVTMGAHLYGADIPVGVLSAAGFLAITGLVAHAFLWLVAAKRLPLWRAESQDVPERTDPVEN